MIFIDTLKKTIGNRIRNLRLELGISTEELAEIIDISPAFVGLIERGQRGTSLENLIKMSKVFNVSMDYLIFGAESDEIFYKTPEEKKIDRLNALIQGLGNDKLTILNTLACELRKIDTRSTVNINEISDCHDCKNT